MTHLLRCENCERPLPAAELSLDEVGLVARSYCIACGFLSVSFCDLRRFGDGVSEVSLPRDAQGNWRGGVEGVVVHFPG